MRNRICLVIFVMMAAHWCLGQARQRKMPANINHSSVNNFSPYVSLDGNAVVYISDAEEDQMLTMTYSLREGVNWKDPVILPKTVNNKLNFLRGFSLSADGKTLFISNMRSNGIGAFDLYTSQLNGTTWTEPVNVSIPVNSKGNEACASLSADGSTLFFMRCDKMDFNKASGCKILMVKKKPNGQWNDPVELPFSINTGNSQSPRILGDGETLLFASDKLPGSKGGMDLYMTRISNGQWSAPRPLDFANTSGDDQYASATAAGRYLLRDLPGTHNQELVEILFPADLRPKGAMKIEGKISGPEASSAFVTLFNLDDQSQVFAAKPSLDGSFVVYAREGRKYDLSVDPEKDNFTFFSKKFDLTTEKFSLIEKVDVHLGPAESGDEISLEGIYFKPYSSEIHPDSKQELRRLTRFMQGNPERSFSIQVTLEGFERDTIQSSPDLTELQSDTLHYSITYAIDSLTTGTRDSMVVKHTYHNDRTLRQAKAISEFLMSQGIPSRKIASSGKAMPEAVLEERRTIVKVIIH